MTLQEQREYSVSFAIYTLFAICSIYLLASLLTLGTWQSADGPTGADPIALSVVGVEGLNRRIQAARGKLRFTYGTRPSKLVQQSLDSIRTNGLILEIDVMLQSADISGTSTDQIVQLIRNNTKQSISVSAQPFSGIYFSFNDSSFCFSSQEEENSGQDIRIVCVDNLGPRYFVTGQDENKLFFAGNPITSSNRTVYSTVDAIGAAEDLIAGSDDPIDIYTTEFVPLADSRYSNIINSLLAKRGKQQAVSLHTGTANTFTEALQGAGVSVDGNTCGVNAIIIGDSDVMVMSQPVTVERQDPGVVLVVRGDTQFAASLRCT